MIRQKMFGSVVRGVALVSSASMALAACADMAVEGPSGVDSTEQAEEIELGVSTQGLVADYDKCADILGEGLRDEWEMNRDQSTAGILTDWVCDRSSTTFTIDHEGSFGFMGFEGDQDWNVTREKIRDYCESNQRAYNDSSFSYHSLTRVANQGVVQAWRDCMLHENDMPFLCEPKEQNGLVSFNLTWDTLDSAPEIDLEWNLVSNVRAAGTLPSSMGEGTRSGYVEIQSRSRPALVSVTASGLRPGGARFNYTCDLAIEPIAPVAQTPITPATGNIHINAIESNGEIGEIEKLYRWTRGWTTTEFVQIGGKTYLFLLKKGTGDIHVEELKADGTVKERVDTRKWSTGWSDARFYTVGGKTYLLLLKADSGEVHIHKMEDNGVIGDEIKRYNWTSGWTAVRFYNMGGSTFMFLLKESTGDMHIHKMKADGTIGDKLDDANWSSGWTTAEPYSVGGHTYLLLLKKSTGDMHINELLANGSVGTDILQDERWTSGWSSAAFYARGNKTYLMVLKSSDGEMHVQQMNTNGTIGGRVDTQNWSSGWTSAKTYKVGTTPHLFLLKK